MFDQAVRASEAVNAGLGQAAGALLPALWGCVDCGTARMISSPARIFCRDCGKEFAVLSYSRIGQVVMKAV